MEPIVLVKLKMRMVYKAFLSIVGLLIILMAFVGIYYLTGGKRFFFNSDIEVKGALSINYVDGKKFTVDKSKTVKFTVSNGSDNVGYYNIGFNQIRGDGSYKIYYNDKVIMEGTLTTIDEILTDYVSIDSKETKNYTLEITNNNLEPLKGYISIYNQNAKTQTFSDVILKNNPASESTLTKVGSELALENEGLIKSSDDIGVSYYFRGDVSNNYVKFSDKLWRIVRINGDGTVRLVLDSPVDTLGIFYEKTDELKNFEQTKMNTFLENWLEQNIRDNVKYIANTKYCYDSMTESAETSLAYSRIVTNKLPTLNCLGTQVNNNIGLLTIDEIILAGANLTGNNQKYYLYNSSIDNDWFTMSMAKDAGNNVNMFMVSENGGIKYDVSGNLYRSVRPVVNIIKNVEVTGKGTKEDAYVIK